MSIKKKKKEKITAVTFNFHTTHLEEHGTTHCHRTAVVSLHKITFYLKEIIHSDLL